MPEIKKESKSCGMIYHVMWPVVSLKGVPTYCPFCGELERFAEEDEEDD